MTVGNHFFLGRAALAAAMSIGIPSAAHAALVTESFTDSYAVAPGAGTFTQNLDFQKFDSNLGLLQSIAVDLVGSGYAILNLFNFDTHLVSYTASTSGDIQVAALGLLGVLANITTGQVSGAAAIGFTNINSSTQSFDVSGAMSPAQFATYTGTGTANLLLTIGPWLVTNTFGPHAAGTTASGGDGDVAGTVSVTYTYDDSYAVPVPEPSTLAVFGTGIFLLGFLGRRKATVGGRDDLLPPGAAA
jgi:hypothetical protein